jgi:hypothetical protein
MRDHVCYQHQFYALLRIHYPKASGDTLPVRCRVWGKLDPNMYVSACYFECRGVRTNADRMVSRGGTWVALFSKLPECNGSGILTVEGTTWDDALSFRRECDNLSVDPRMEIDREQEAAADWWPKQITISNPLAGNPWPSPYDAS